MKRVDFFLKLGSLHVGIYLMFLNYLNFIIRDYRENEFNRYTD